MRAMSLLASLKILKDLSANNDIIERTHLDFHRIPFDRQSFTKLSSLGSGLMRLKLTLSVNIFAPDLKWRQWAALYAYCSRCLECLRHSNFKCFRTDDYYIKNSKFLTHQSGLKRFKSGSRKCF